MAVVEPFGRTLAAERVAADASASVSAADLASIYSNLSIRLGGVMDDISS